MPVLSEKQIDIGFFNFHLKMLMMPLICMKLLGKCLLKSCTCIKQICGYAMFSRMSGTNKKKFNFLILSSEVTGSLRQKKWDLESQAQASLSKGCKKAAAILKETDRQMS
jgi:hypothetical protein